MLLLLGSQLRGDTEALMARSVGSEQFVEAVPDEEMTALGVPRLARSRGLIDPQRVRTFLSQRYGSIISETVTAEPEPHLPEDVLADIAGSVFREPAPENATDLIEGCMRHPRELVRVAVAVAYHERSPERQRLIRVLEDGVRSADELVRDLAATGLAQTDAENSRLKQLQLRVKGAASGAASHTSLLVHGTWAVDSSFLVAAAQPRFLQVPAGQCVSRSVRRR